MYIAQRLRIFHSYCDVKTAVEWLQNIGLSVLSACERYAEMDLYHVKPAMTWSLGVHSLIQWTTPLVVSWY